MKSSGIFKINGRWLYPLLCAAVVALSIGTVAAFRHQANSLTEDLVNDTLNTPSTPDLSRVDKILDNIPKDTPVAAPTDKVSSSDAPGTLEEVFYQKAIYMPVSGTNVIGEFSFGELVKSASGVWKTHDGVDLSADLGDEVKAMTSGNVTRVYRDQLWGNCVEIYHDDALTGHYYGLADDILVAEGDQVNAGQVIGYVGKTEIEADAEPHLHFGLKYADQWVDPISYIEPYK